MNGARLAVVAVAILVIGCSGGADNNDGKDHVDQAVAVAKAVLAKLG